MKPLLTILSLLSVLLTGCYKEPFADATISPNPAYVGLDVFFDNYSTNTGSVEWDLGDGYFSTDFNVTHYYEYPGFYDVTLKAYGEKNSVDVLTFELEVIGSSVRIVVWDNVTDARIPSASILLYPTIQDWDNQTNSSEEFFTDSNGECTIYGLAYKHYYVDVWVNDGYNNWGLGQSSVDWIETQLLIGNSNNTFDAYIDIYPLNKKAATGTRERPDYIKAGPKGADPSYLLKNNKISIPKEK